MFYGTKIKAGQSVQPKYEDGGEILHLSQICLNDPTDNAKVYVQVHNGNDVYTICILEKGKNECVSMDLFIDTTKNIKISTRGGKNEVHLVGYFEPPHSEEEDDEELDEESFMKSLKSNKGKLQNGTSKKKIEDLDEEDEDEDDEDDENDEEELKKALAGSDDDDDDEEGEEDNEDGEEDNEEGDDDEDEDEDENKESNEEEESDEEPSIPNKNDKKRKNQNQLPKSQNKPEKKAKTEINGNTNKSSSGSSSSDGSCDQYKKSLIEFLKKNGRTNIGSLGQKVVKPKTLTDKLGKFLKDHTDTFKIENGFVSLK